MTNSEGHIPKEEFMGSNEPPLRNQERPKGKTRDIHIRVTEDDHAFLLNEFGGG